MDHSTYQLVINTRVPEGYIETAKFFIGDSEDEAGNIWGLLHGTPVSGDNTMLRLDLIEQGTDIDSVVATMDCTLEEITCNTKTIIKETFRILNLT